MKTALQKTSITTNETLQLGTFLFDHLRRGGVKHIFGIPGDYILPLFKTLEGTPGIDPVVGTHEPNSAFSADAYARLNGLGVLLITYGVGGFNAMNGVACAYAESSPLLVISGGPPRGIKFSDDPITTQAHHLVKHPGSQLGAYSHITTLALRIEDPATAAETITIATTVAVQQKLPVYLEIPTDLMTVEIPISLKPAPSEMTDFDTLDQAVSFFSNRIEKAQNPIILAGAEISRFGLQSEILAISAAGGIPIATSVLGKGTFDETQPNILGMYAGVISQNNQVREIVESSDLVIMLGMKITDVNCGAFTANLRRDQILVAKSGWIGDGYLRFDADLSLRQFIMTLVAQLPSLEISQASYPEISTSFPHHITPMDQYLSTINDHLSPEHIVVADTGDSIYGSLSLTTRRENGYLAPSFYNSMGFAVPAALGAALAVVDARPIVLVGDGAFQMTGMEFSNFVKLGLNPIVIIFNNSGFGMQRVFVDGSFNDIPGWDYGKVVELVGGGQFYRVASPDEMAATFKTALDVPTGPVLIEVLVEKGTISTGLKIFGEALHREKQGVCPLNTGETPCDHETQCAFCRAAIWK
jgi:indolepyruvate decarboxylase